MRLTTCFIFHHGLLDMLAQGENLAWGSSMTFDRAVELWYNTGSNYNYNSNSMGRSGHFTQVGKSPRWSRML